ncbi:uncharacterized protein LOC111283279 isoform X1 [Durio zibethinus]|uniref:Uncharacterized protein LOC111283279 isoform X1 n=1 Tax=Durio zibethinus TaxID=66656 RepID=A0A6P5XGI9_DURZI|nr:uncharacterized protein LOC111283279 isoform X1 [Durio zibethinus]
MNWGHNANSFLLGFCIDFSFFPFLSQFCITYPYSTLMHVKLCGHATLASAHSLFMVNSNIIEFDTLSGILTAKTVPDVNPAYVSKIQNGGVHEYFLIKLNFPSVPITEFNSAEVSAISKALNGAPPIDIKRTTTADDLFVVLPSRKSVIEIGPLFDDILKCPGRGLIVSGVAPPDSKFDFISRFFCPKYGINEVIHYTLSQTIAISSKRLLCLIHLSYTL